MEKTMIINLIDIDQIPLGQSRCFIVHDGHSQGVEIAVIRPRSGGIFALENQCPHRRGPLSEGIVGGDKIVCPLHGHKFDLVTGKGSEVHECVRVFKVWEESGQIMLEYHSLGSLCQEEQNAIK
jgi:nitrite reductase (NADH) small subunit